MKALGASELIQVRNTFWGYVLSSQLMSLAYPSLVGGSEWESTVVMNCSPSLSLGSSLTERQDCGLSHL